MDTTYTKKDVFIDVCHTLKEVGETLVANPKEPRPLRLAADRLQALATYVGDRHMVFLASYLKLLSDDLWFNIMTDNSARVSIKDRDNLLKDMGKILTDLSAHLEKRRVAKIYNCYLQLGDLWNKVPSLRNEKVETATSGGGEDSLTRATKQAITQSVNILSSGFPSDWHMDIDSVLCRAKESGLLAKEYVTKIKEMQKQGIEIDKLGFIDKVYGPVGSIALMSSIAAGTGIDSIIIRLRRRIQIGQAKGAKMRKEDFVLIVSDVLTTGDGIIEAADIVRKYANVENALVYLDRNQGGKERLRLHGIDVETICVPGKLVSKRISKRTKPLPIGGDELFVKDIK